MPLPEVKRIFSHASSQSRLSDRKSFRDIGAPPRPGAPISSDSSQDCVRITPVRRIGEAPTGEWAASDEL
ncbi:hypothetical protein PHSY_003365 [Pseudozyma hubeiensis SY62]|uniref:Uncharacterized protein n=1 Tax=Pseudozyma hubeiensis (strain SY62) TaxID=1305764 RepID=R9P3B8_PSEHS|nr:hypothetical protein PHSY_003365 [Pseudozyma hubeiensis SY62]GAC95789.1 hypothetical protein PHSY_003365 [Pseudozyma hubeiensis SY62]